MAEQKSFIAITDRDDHIRWLQRALRDEGEVLVADVHALERVMKIIDVTGAAVVFIEIFPDQIKQQMALIEGLLTAKPLLNVIVLSKHMDHQLVLAAMRAGARDFIVPGSDPTDLAALVHRLGDRSPHLQSSGEQGRIVSLVSSRPDADTVMLAIHLGLVLQESDHGDVLLLDLGVPQGDALTCLGLTSSYTFVDAVRSLRRLDDTLIESAFAKHASGMHVLSLPQDATGLEDITSADIYVLLGTLKAYFGTILVNLGGVPETEFLHLILSQTDQALLVVEQSVPSCKQNMRLINRLTHNKVASDNISLVVDRYYEKLPPDADSVAKGFGLPLAATLPPSGLQRLNVVNSGLSMFEMAPRDPYALAVRKLGRQLTEQLFAGVAGRRKKGGNGRRGWFGLLRAGSA